MSTGPPAGPGAPALPPALVVGVGNEWRSDDGVGLAVVRRLAAEGLPTLELDGEPSTLVDALGAARRVVVVDAVRAGAPPGTVHRFDCTQAPLPLPPFQSSTHMLGLADAVELARALGRLAPEVVVVGIEGGEWDTRQGLSPEVAAAVWPAVEAVRAELAR